MNFFYTIYYIEDPTFITRLYALRYCLSSRLKFRKINTSAIIYQDFLKNIVIVDFAFLENAAEIYILNHALKIKNFFIFKKFKTFLKKVGYKSQKWIKTPQRNNSKHFGPYFLPGFLFGGGLKKKSPNC